jgi:tripartite-type tricarboxylate transporter receptor subunit TctC
VLNIRATLGWSSRLLRHVAVLRPLGAVLALVGSVSLLASINEAIAQTAASYPSKTIRFVVPYPAGGGTDVIARLIGVKLTEAWGQQVIVENKAGASGILGNDAVAKALPDGYTVLIGITTLVQMPHLNPKLPYDVFKDFTPITQLALSSNLFAVPASSTANTLKDYIAMAKAEPARFNYGSFGAGTTSHLHGELFNLQAGTKMAHIPYKGGAPLATDIMGGQVTSGLIDLASARAHLSSGRMKFLAISGNKRFAALPNVPTFAEAGLKDFEASGWFAMFLPANAPKEVVAKLAGEMARIMKLPDVQAKLNDMGLQAVESNPEVFAATLKSDYAVWGRIVRDAHIKLD